MSRICKTCGSLFKATGNEQECPTCKEGFNDIMDIIKGRDSKDTVKDSKKTEAPPTTPEPSPKMTICKVCGKEFEQTGKGRPAVNCPECREALKHEYKMPAKVKPAEPKARPTVSVATEEFKGWCKGNALKYSLRAGRKDPAKEVQDLAKAGVFLSWITGE